MRVREQNGIEALDARPERLKAEVQRRIAQNVVAARRQQDGGPQPVAARIFGPANTQWHMIVRRPTLVPDPRAVMVTARGEPIYGCVPSITRCPSIVNLPLLSS